MNNTTIAAAVAYISAACMANYVIHFFGPEATIVTAFILIGVDLSLRDLLHAEIGVRRIILLSLLASAISYAVNPAGSAIAVASFVSFSTGAVVDALIFHRLRNRAWAIKCNASNLMSAAVDSLLFPTLAFGAFMPFISTGQWAAKVAGGAIWVTIIIYFKNKKVPA